MGVKLQRGIVASSSIGVCQHVLDLYDVTEEGLFHPSKDFRSSKLRRPKTLLRLVADQFQRAAFYPYL